MEIAQLSRARQGFQELADVYGIPNSGMEIVIAEEDNERESLVVTDRIYGQNLEEALQDNPSGNLLDQATVLTRSLANYYIDKGKCGGDYWYDPGLKQFMYGHKIGQSDRIHLVDVDSDFGAYDPLRENRAGTILYLNVFEDLAEFTCGMSNAHRGHDIADTKQRVKDHLDSLPQSSEFRSKIDSIKQLFD